MTMDRQRQKQLDGLLARGGLSGAARERVLESVLQTAKPRRSWLMQGVRWGALPAALLVASALVLNPRAAENARFRAKGEVLGKTVAQFELVCGARGATGTHCSTSDTLYFSANRISSEPFLSAYADPEGGGERLWFFPSTGQPSLELRASSAHQAASRAIPLRGIPAGRYRVTLLLSAAPLSRAQALAARPAQVIALEVVP